MVVCVRTTTTRSKGRFANRMVDYVRSLSRCYAREARIGARSSEPDNFDRQHRGKGAAIDIESAANTAALLITLP